MPPATSILSLIGRTPLVELTGFDTGHCRLFLKLELANPGGSIKDRIGLSMVDDAERRGVLVPGGTLVEATAGNTGLGLALVARRKGYRLILVIPDKMSREKVHHLKAMGAEVVMTRSDVGKGHPEYYQDLAERIARETPGAVYVNQFANPANPRAHETGTGPELLEQMEGRIDAVVVGVGSGGTLGGLTRFFSRALPSVSMVLADPTGSVLAGYVRDGTIGEAGSWLVEGIGEDFVPAIADFSMTRAAYSIDDAESLATARELLRREGILAGSSTGTLLAAALRYCREQTEPRRVVTFACDTGNKYLSKLYNDAWLFDQGMAARRHGDLRDFIPRPHAERAVVTVRQREPLLQAYLRMRAEDVSQLPVMDGDRVVGLITEAALLDAVATDRGRFSDPVSSVMDRRFATVRPDDPPERLAGALHDGPAVVVCDGSRFWGLITRIDYLAGLRNGVPGRPAADA